MYHRMLSQRPLCIQPDARHCGSGAQTMLPIKAETEEEERQLQLLSLPLGAPESGWHRYGAAMYFYQLGKLDADTLEAYRICCNLDFEDPAAVASSRQTPGQTG
jgi:hypothetical protein